MLSFRLVSREGINHCVCIRNSLTWESQDSSKCYPWSILTIIHIPPRKKKVSQVSNILRIERTTTKACGLKLWATLKIIFPQFLLLHLYRVLGVNIFLKTNSTWHHHLDRKAPHFGDATSTNFPPFPQIFRKSQTWSDSFNGLMNKTRPLPSYLTSWLVIGNSPGGGYNIPYHSPQ